MQTLPERMCEVRSMVSDYDGGSCGSVPSGVCIVLWICPWGTSKAVIRLVRSLKATF